jgi:subtilase family serine protease
MLARACSDLNECVEGAREAIADSLNEVQESDETNNTSNALVIC